MCAAFVEADVAVEEYGPYKRLAIECGEIREVAFLDRNQCLTLASFLERFLEANIAQRCQMELSIFPDTERIHVECSGRFCISLSINDVEAQLESWDVRTLIGDLLDWGDKI